MGGLDGNGAPYYPNSVTPQLRNSVTPQLRISVTPQLPNSSTPQLRKSEIFVEVFMCEAKEFGS